MNREKSNGEKVVAQKRLDTRFIRRVFQDTNGDGIGDLKGVIRHLDKIEKLGSQCHLALPGVCIPDGR